MCAGGSSGDGGGGGDDDGRDGDRMMDGEAQVMQVSSI